MKKLLFAILVSGMALTHAQQGDRVGNGGSGDEAQLAAQQVTLEQVTLKIKLFFVKNKAEMEKTFETVSSKVLSDTISRMDIEVTNAKLTDRHGKTRTCLNFEGRELVQCNYDLLQKIENDPKAVFVLMFHEILGLMGLEETSPQNPADIDGYKISKKIALYVTKVNGYDLKLSNSSAESGKCTVYWDDQGFRTPRDATIELILEKKGYQVVDNKEDANFEAKIQSHTMNGTFGFRRYASAHSTFIVTEIKTGKGIGWTGHHEPVFGEAKIHKATAKSLKYFSEADFVCRPRH